MELFGFDLWSVIYVGLIGSPFEIFKNIFQLKRKFESKVDLKGKTAVITGGNTGIGRETALQLTLRGAKVIIGCRNVSKAMDAIKEIKNINACAQISSLELDLSSLKSVRQFSHEISKSNSNIDILINNAGVMLCPEWKTKDGFEMQFGTNHLGHFLLTLSLMPLLKKSSKARVVTVSSSAHMIGTINLENINLRNAYGAQRAYSQSKLANVLFSRELARRLGPQSTVTTYSLHPGIIRTELWRHVKQPKNAFLARLDNFFKKLLLIDPVLGSQTTLYCALEPSLDNESGYYYDDCRRVDEKCMVWRARDDKTARLLWDLSCDLVNIEDYLKL